METNDVKEAIESMDTMIGNIHKENYGEVLKSVILMKAYFKQVLRGSV